MGKLKKIIENELQRNDLSYRLTNHTDYKLGFQISKRGYLTETHIIRHNTNPQEVEILVDYGLAKRKDVIRTYQPITGLFSGTFQFMWLLLFFGLTFITVVLAITGLFSLILENITPKWTYQKRVISIIGIIIIVIFFWIIIVPKLLKRRVINIKNFDKYIMNTLISRLQILNEELMTTTLCWSCFKKIKLDVDLCVFCGVKQK